MKAIRSILSVCLLAVASSVSAQFVNSRNVPTYANRPSSETHLSINSDVDNYGRWSISYLLSNPIFEGSSSSIDDLFHGVGIGYMFGINITGHNLPLFLEFGPEVNYAISSTNDYHWGDATAHLLSVVCPVNLTYKLHVSDNITISPFVGINNRVNCLGMIKGDKRDADFFDSSDFGSNTANRYQFGMNVGMGVYFGKFYVGYRYNKDFSDYLKDMTFDNHYLSLGIKI